jgi:hypothetical protein
LRKKGKPKAATLSPPVTAALHQEVEVGGEHSLNWPSGRALSAHEHISLCEALDRILTKGAVVAGEVMISVANVDLLYLGLQLVITSIGRSGQSLSLARGPLSLEKIYS